MSMKMRYYQDGLVECVSGKFNAGFKRVCVQLETGGGKTGIAADMTKRIMSKRRSGERGVALLFLVGRDLLVYQTVETLVKIGMNREDIGIITTSANSVDCFKPIQVALITTLMRRKHKYDHWLKPKVIIIDEAHHAVAATWLKLINHYNAHLIGLTATPRRLDGKSLKDVFQSLCVGPSYQELADEGFLANISVKKIPSGVDIKKIKKTDVGDEERSSGVVIVDDVATYFKLAQGKRTIHFSKTIDHSKSFVQSLREKGVNAESISSEDSKDYRRDVLQRFKDGVTTVLSNVQILTEGFDCPECECVIMARSTSSFTLYKQMVGRLTRPKSDGRNALLIDCVGNVDEHGLPNEPCTWILEAKSKEEKKAREALRTRDNNLRNCDSCFEMFFRELEECPRCGQKVSKMIPDKVDLELIDAGEAERVREQRKLDVKQGIKESMGDISKLRDVARANGYKDGWAYQTSKQPAWIAFWDRKKREIEAARLAEQNKTKTEE